MRKNIIKLISITMIGSSLFFTGCKILPNEDRGSVPILSKAKKVEYRTYKATKGDIIEEYQGYGVAMSLNRQKIHANMEGGKIKNIYFKQGEFVKKGDIIAEFYSDNLDEEIELQELNVRVAEINYEKIKNESSNEYEKSLAEVTLDYETNKLNRMKIKREGLIFYSPIDGILTKVRNYKVGSELKYNDIIAVVDGSDEIVIHNNITFQNIGFYSVGMDAIITHKNKDYQGEVIKVLEEDNKDTKESQGIYIKFKDKIPDELEFDKNIKYKVIGDKKENVLRIPAQAVYQASDLNYVFVLENGLKIKQFVEVGMVTNKYVEIISGLQENEEFVLK